MNYGFGGCSYKSHSRCLQSGLFYPVNKEYMVSLSLLWKTIIWLLEVEYVPGVVFRVW